MGEAANHIPAEGTPGVPANERPRWVKELTDWAKSILFALVLVFLIHQFVFHLSKVDGQSMEPTLEHGERLFINKMIYYFDEPARGDVVILKNPSEFDKRYLVKRVIGIPGDTIEIRSGFLYVNGEKQIEQYTEDIQIEDGDHGPVVLSEEQYFVMGDNRHAGASYDSRDFDAVDRDLIKGRAEFILWPVTKWGAL